MKTEPTLEWTLTRAESGTSFRIDYSVRNGTHKPVYILDQLIITAGSAGYERVPERIIVRAGEAPTQVELVRDYVPAEAKVLMQLVPGARWLEAGASLSDHATLPMPLTAWHPNGHARPLPAQPNTVVLKIGYVSGELEWDHPPLTDGTKLIAPTLRDAALHQQFLQSQPLTWPPK